MKPKLRAADMALAISLREADEELWDHDVEARLRDEISDHYRGTSDWGYFVTRRGDGNSGDVVYSCGGDLMMCGYEISGTSGAAKCTLDWDNAVDVVPRTTYEVEEDEADHYAAMESAQLYTAGSARLFERFISKDQRARMAPEDFAGKSKSFPIKTQGDYDAAVRSVGRAGPGNHPPQTILKNADAIARRKGLKLRKGAQSASDPKESWSEPILRQLSEAGARHSAGDMQMIQAIHDKSGELGAKCGEGSGDAKEGAVNVLGPLKLCESTVFAAEVQVSEAARTNYPIRIISPGTGSTAHYTAAVLEREAPKFRPGTLMFWNHPTVTEESQRPEGDLNNLAAIITSQGRWDPNGSKGPGVYAEAKVMADYAQKVEERAPHIGLSIRAGGIQDGTNTINGKPVLKEFSYIESVDYVTKAGRGGLALAEAARSALGEQQAAPVAESNTEVGDMPITEEELKLLRENNARLMERAIYQDALIVSRRILDDVSIPEAAKMMVCENIIGTEGAWKALPCKGGALDSLKFGELINAEAKRIGKMLHASGVSTGRPVGVGPELLPQPTAQEISAKESARKSEEEEAIKVFESLGMTPEQAKFAAQGRAA